MPVSNYSQQHFVLCIIFWLFFFSWVKPQVQPFFGFFLFFLNMDFKNNIIFISFGHFLQPMGYCWGGGMAAMQPVSPCRHHQAIMVNEPLTAFVLLPFM